MSRSVFAVSLTACFCGILSGATPTIGVAMSSGHFLLDHSRVAGNANLSEGSVIETEKARSDMSLTNGLKMRLGADSRGQVFSNRLVLQQGVGEVTGSNYVVKAGRLVVTPVGPNATARVLFAAKNVMEVAAVGGAVLVTTAEGVALTTMPANTSLSFSEQAGASSPTSLCGRLVRQNGKYLMNGTEVKSTDNLDQYVGRSISVSGNRLDDGTFRVLSGTEKRDSCGVPPAGAAAGAAGHGLSHGAIAGIVIGSAAAVGLGIAAGVGAFDTSN